ncbi:MAG: holo-ACP synthase [Pseudoduganella sp.]|jgi:holo-[acyl-carrier protein] synthase|nr:holo-ACP synthase [Pseudoduganella sp.]
MIYGIGTDVCKVPRIAAALERSGERFARKILGPDEYAVYVERSARSAVRGVRYAASRFAAKEAFSKALGLGLRQPMTWHTAQLLNDDLGKPYMACSGALGEFMLQNALVAHISVSDEEDYAVAYAIVERAND